jgi:hypothetical protein
MSVIGMMAMPFLIIGTIGFFLWRATKVAPPGEGGPGA